MCVWCVQSDRLLSNYFRPVCAAHGLDFQITHITGVHEFTRNLTPSIDLKGAFKTRDGIEAPHLFVVCRRDGPRGTPWALTQDPSPAEVQRLPSLTFPSRGGRDEGTDLVQHLSERTGWWQYGGRPVRAGRSGSRDRSYEAHALSGGSGEGLQGPCAYVNPKPVYPFPNLQTPSSLIPAIFRARGMPCPPSPGLNRASEASAEQRLPRGVQKHQGDVFITVRQWMSDGPGKSQAPLLVYPQAYFGEVRTWMAGLAIG